MPNLGGTPDCSGKCEQDNHCLPKQKCNTRLGTCENPCEGEYKDICGANSECLVTNHQPFCQCDKFFRGTLGTLSLPSEPCKKVECQHDRDCKCNMKCDIEKGDQPLH